MTAFFDELRTQVPEYRTGSLSDAIRGDCGNSRKGCVGLAAQDLPPARPLTGDEQWARDLEVLDRCEQQYGCDVDFFACMGELSRGRTI